MSLMDKPLHALALSGGGYRGLYTAQVIADLENEIGGPIASKFDLIAGTSIGGILAVALALEIPAKRIVELFVKHGGDIFAKRWTLWGLLRAPYSPLKLKSLLISDDLFGERLMGACKHRVIVPAINYTTGQAVVFKTPHHAALRRDHKTALIDIALATSAAPAYFPRHRFANSQYVDGGLFANAPGLLALHEATEFLNASTERVHILSIGAMSSRFTVDARRSMTGGAFDWGGMNPLNMPRRLFGLSISVQEIQTYNMLVHRLGDRYVHVDDSLSDERAHSVALDKTDGVAQELLLGVAHERSKACLGDTRIRQFLNHQSASPHFYYGENASENCPC